MNLIQENNVLFTDNKVLFKEIKNQLNRYNCEEINLKELKSFIFKIDNNSNYKINYFFNIVNNFFNNILDVFLNKYFSPTYFQSFELNELSKMKKNNLIFYFSFNLEKQNELNNDDEIFSLFEITQLQKTNKMKIFKLKIE